jgi:prevent-host-death family protein
MVGNVKRLDRFRTGRQDVSGQLPVTTMSAMKVVGIRQLKARLSEYVRLAKAGETVLVTERGKVVAELRPSRRQTSAADRVEEELEDLAAAGEITRAAVVKGDWTWRSRGLGLPAGALQRLLDDLGRARS